MLPRLVAILALLLCLSPARAAGPEAVEAVRIGQNGAVTRLVLDLQGLPAYRVFLLADPPRVVVDLPDLDWRAAHAAEGRGLIQRWRHGLYQTGTSRLVLDLSRTANVKSVFTLPPAEGKGPRLVLDLAPADPINFATQLDQHWGTRPEVVEAALPQVPLKTTRPREGKKIIAIDAGHGGVDPGAIAVDGTFEKHITLATARALKAELEATGRYTVMLTRDRDVYLRLRERVALARASAADLFISLHADSIGKSDVRGASVHTLSENASDGEAARLAAKENRADAIAGVDLDGEGDDVANILIDLAMRDSMNQSKYFANLLVASMGQGGIRLLPRTHRSAGFAVLKAPDMPSVLVELGYLSNAEEARQLASPSYEADLARSIRAAVDGYFAWLDKVNRI